MNVFVLNSGRCGSATFIKACRHISNFSAGHESLATRLGAERLAYPPRHIEADNRLSWLLGRLDDAYGAGAYYVHQTRALAPTAASFSRRFTLDIGIMPAYQHGILMGAEGAEPLAVAKDYLHTIDSNIRHFLRDKPHQMHFSLETAQADFARFWEWIGAEGDKQAALAEWHVRHNAS